MSKNRLISFKYGEMKMIEQFDLIDTQDFGLAVALICKKYDLLDLDKSFGARRITFRFADKPGINQASQDYWNGKLLVDAKTYWSESKNLKTRLYSLG